MFNIPTLAPGNFQTTSNGLKECLITDTSISSADLMIEFIKNILLDNRLLVEESVKLTFYEIKDFDNIIKEFERKIKRINKIIRLSGSFRDLTQDQIEIFEKSLDRNQFPIK